MRVLIKITYCNIQTTIDIEKPLLRPTNPAGLDNLAQCPCPRETRCKTSYTKRLLKLTFILNF